VDTRGLRLAESSVALVSVSVWLDPSGGGQIDIKVLEAVSISNAVVLAGRNDFRTAYSDGQAEKIL